MNTNTPTTDIPADATMTDTPADPMMEIRQFMQTLAAQQLKQSEQIQYLHTKLESATSKTTSTTPEPAASVAASMQSESTSDSQLNTTIQNTNYRLSERLPDPSAFTGKRRDLLSFIDEMKNKLHGNADRFPTADEQFTYVRSRIQGEAATIIRPLLGNNITTVNNLFSFLEATYGDPNRKDTAQVKLGAIRQGRKSFITFFAEFRRLASDSELNEAGLITILRHALNPDLQRAMVGVKVPDKLNDYANLIQTFDNDLRYLALQSASSDRVGRHKNIFSNKDSDPDAMDLDHIGTYAPVGSKERQRRMDKRLCYKCASSKHLSFDCDVPIPRTRIQTVASRNLSNDNRAFTENSRDSQSDTDSHDSATPARATGKGPSRN